MRGKQRSSAIRAQSILSFTAKGNAEKRQTLRTELLKAVARADHRFFRYAHDPHRRIAIGGNAAQCFDGDRLRGLAGERDRLHAGVRYRRGSTSFMVLDDDDDLTRLHHATG